MPKKKQTTDFPSSIRWTGSNKSYARKLAAREHRSVNAFINLTMERMWMEQLHHDSMNRTSGDK